MALELEMQLFWCHCPGLFGELLNEGVFEDLVSGEDFEEAEFALVIKIECAGSEV